MDEEKTETTETTKTETTDIVNQPITEEEYNKTLADISLDRAKLVLLRMQKMFEVEQVDFDIAQLDAARAAIDRRRVITLIGVDPAKETTEK